MTRKEFRNRASKQIPLVDKVSWADYVILNDSSIENLKQRTRTIYNELLRFKPVKG
jgi:dephospho-CoA kinase